MHEAEPSGGHDPAHAKMAAEMPLVSVLPFVLLLLAIAIFPLFAPHWWEHNRNKAIVATLLAVPVVVYLFVAWQSAGLHELVEKVEEYASFMVLLGTLFIITGGIYVKGSLTGTPLANTMLLALGATIASVIGTTGASVLLIRPLLRANATRQRKAHIVVFFIFIVSNCGGLLTPLGDPPLFLGFIKGVPFEWTLLNLWQHWLFVNIALLIIFHIWDEVVINREEKQRAGSQLEEVLKHEPLRILGLHNFVLLAGVVATIFAYGQGWLYPWAPWPAAMPVAIMAGLAIAGYVLTPRANRENNKFTFGPIIEVAVLFAGIFITMAPALLILNAWGHGDRTVLGQSFGMDQPWQFFWAAGLLSSLLDNAPTYLTFASTACGLKNVELTGSYLSTFLAQTGGAGPDPARLLAAISCGAVFMGANTYIGNGPNFMVKAVAEQSGVKMPSFFGYFALSVVLLFPLFVLVTFLFLV